MDASDLRMDMPELDGVATDFLEPEGPDLLGRWDLHQGFWDARLAAGLDPHGRAVITRVGPIGKALTRGQERIAGVNFASGDYLSLASHPSVREAAVEAVERWGVHSAGTAAFQGGSQPLLVLEERLAELLCCRDATVFPTGWAAGYGVVRALVREGDHVVTDCLAHPCFQEAAAAATPHLHRIPHLSHEAMEQRLARIRADNPRAGILLVTESLFPVDSSVPDLRALRDSCRAHGATLLVGVAHDLGAIGGGGLGFLGEQGLVGETDIVVGSFSKTFASTGGFVASGAPGLKQALRGFATTLAASTALSPVQASVVLTGLGIVCSAEGAERRRQLMDNVLRLREGLAARAFGVLGQPSAIVPTAIGNIVEARLMTRAAIRGGALVNLLEHPAVSRGVSRWPLEVMAGHSAAQIDRMIGIAVSSREVVQMPGRYGPLAWPAPLRER